MKSQQVLRNIYPQWGGNIATGDTSSGLVRIVPHARTLRKAREQVKQMIISGVSPQRIRSYLFRWLTWWVKTSESWQCEEVLGWFINVCRDASVTAYALSLLKHPRIKPHHSPSSHFSAWA